MNQKKQAVLLLSGGLDSAANLSLSESFEVKLALTVNYGQKSATREMQAAEQLCKYFGIEHLVFKLPQFKELVGQRNALMGAAHIPTPALLDDLKITQNTAKAVWVPNRNGVFISLAAACAEAREFDAVVVGFNVEEAQTFPDNTSDFMVAMTQALEFSTINKVQVVSATACLTKTQIIKKLADLAFPFHLLWSCYRGGKTHCGSCESCLRLERALRQGLSESHSVWSSLKF